jgi:hypothetical protein
MAAIIGDAHGDRQWINDTCAHALARISATLQHGAANSALPVRIQDTPRGCLT